MTRINLTDGSGRWFDTEKTVRYTEDTNWNGNNTISVATGSQWEHERLYRTAGRQWVLNHWSNWSGTLETYELIGEAEAARWLSTNGHYEGHAVEQLVCELELV